MPQALPEGGGEAGGRRAEARAGGAGAWGRGPAWPAGLEGPRGAGPAGRAVGVGVWGGAGSCARPARSRAVAAREVWKPLAPGAPTEQGRRGTALSLPLLGLSGQLALTALGNLLTGKLGRKTNANVLEELRVTSLGAEALFSFPAPCPASARLGQRRMCHQLGASGGIPGLAESWST